MSRRAPGLVVSFYLDIATIRNYCNKMEFQRAYEQFPFILGEGALLERLTKELHIEVNPYIAHATCIYDDKEKKALTGIYKQYLDIGKKFDLPMFVLVATWRANQERIRKAKLENKNVNKDNVDYLRSLRKTYSPYANKVFIGGIIGCKGNAYDPKEALDENQAYEFHKYQIEELAKADVDFLIGCTLPAITEAKGIAKRMSETRKPYIISFMIRPQGTLLDGTSIHDAISLIDKNITPPPICYMVNCVHPLVLREALNQKVNKTYLVKTRLKGIQANTSRKSPEELDGSESIDAESPEEYASEMIKFHTDFGIKILAGCCGSDNRHIEQIAIKYRELGK